MPSQDLPTTDEVASSDTHQLTINTTRFLAVAMVERAKSGHPGAPMGQAAMAYQLWTRHLRYDPSQPDWPNRDRFVLSCGHASALIYSLLHLAGYDLPLEQLRDFRQLDSMTPGHPEYGHTPGVETTTGPLGQGLANAVGMAIAERMLAARFNREGRGVEGRRPSGRGGLARKPAASAASITAPTRRRLRADDRSAR